MDEWERTRDAMVKLYPYTTGGSSGGSDGGTSGGGGGGGGPLPRDIVTRSTARRGTPTSVNVNEFPERWYPLMLDPTSNGHINGPSNGQTNGRGSTGTRGGDRDRDLGRGGGVMRPLEFRRPTVLPASVERWIAIQVSVKNHGAGTSYTPRPLTSSPRCAV